MKILSMILLKRYKLNQSKYNKITFYKKYKIKLLILFKLKNNKNKNKSKRNKLLKINILCKIKTI
jgi:hypothetical protein